MQLEGGTSAAPEVSEANDIQNTIDRALAFSAESGDGDEVEEPVEESKEASPEAGDESPDEDDGEDGDEHGKGYDEEAHRAFLEQGRKLGYKLDKGDVKRVTSGERKALQRKLAKFNEEYNDGVRDLEQRATALAERYSRYAQTEKALEMGDMDAVAKTLGYEDWNDLNVSHLKKKASPLYQETQAMKKKLAEKERQEAEREARMAEQRSVQERQEAEQAYAEELELELGQTEEFGEWAEDPDFIGAVITLQRQHYKGGDTITVAEAAQMARDSAYQMYQRLAERFGQADQPGLPDSGATAGKLPSNGATAGKKRGRKPKSISQTETASASSVSETSGMSEDEWFEYHTSLLKQAHG